MDEGISFCPWCGAKVSAGAEFCTECGSSLGPDPVAAPTRADAEKLKDRVVWAAVFAGLYALLAILSGASGMGSSDMVTQVIAEMGDEFDDMLSVIGMTEAEFERLVYWDGVFSLASGLLAAAAAALGATRRRWALCVGCCAAASVVHFGSVAFAGGVMRMSMACAAMFFCAVGLVVTYLLYTGRPAFEDRCRADQH